MLIGFAICMSFLTKIISGEPGLFSAFVLCMAVYRTRPINPPQLWPSTCYLFVNRYISFLIHYHKLSGSAKKAGVLLGIFGLLSVSKLSAASIVSTGTGGIWSASSTWMGGVVPANGDNVTIASGATVNVAGAASCANIIIVGALNIAGTNTLTVTGNWVNDGSFSAGTSGTVEFTGSANSVVSGASTTNFEELRINKGSSQSVLLEINSAVTLSNGGNLSLSNGLLKVNSGGSVICYNNSQIDIPNTGGIHIDGGNLTTGDFSVFNRGLFKVSSGSATLGREAGNSLQTGSGGILQVDGGNLNIAGRLVNTAGTATISGGTINLSTIGHSSSSMASFDMSKTTKLFVTGGTIIFHNPNGSLYDDIHIENTTGIKSITGGIFQLGSVLTPAGSTFKVNSPVSFYDFVVNKENTPSIKLVENDLAISNQLRMQGGNIDGIASGKKVILSKTDINALDNSSGYINGALQRAIGNGVQYLFPVGNTTNGSTSLSLSFSGQNSGGRITISSVAGKYANLGSSLLSSTNYVNNYWTYSNSDVTFSTIDASFYTPTDITTNYRIGLFNTRWSYPDPIYNLPRNIQFSGLAPALMGPSASFVVAECMAPTISGALSVCVGSTIPLTGSGDPDTTVPWSSSDWGVAAINNSGIVSGVSAGTSLVTYMNDAGCRKTVTVTVNPIPDVTPVSNQNLCDGQLTMSVPLVGTPSGVVFDVSGGSAVGLADQVNVLLIPAFIAATGTATVTLTPRFNGCSGEPVNFSITVNTPPVISTQAQDLRVECDGAGNSDDLAGWLANHGGAVAHDASGSEIIWTNNFTSLSDLCGMTGSATVVFTATNMCGNAGSTQAVFTITDTHGPVITCPPATGVTANNACFSTNVALGTPTAYDNCSENSEIIFTNDALAQFPLGITTVMWTAKDACGNTSICTQLITVEDKEKPTFILPSPFIGCVEAISDASFYAPTEDITPCRPEYYTFSSGNTMLDLDVNLFTDNCGLTNCRPLAIRWQIDFSPAPEFTPPYTMVIQPPITGTGQPSSITGNIRFPGDGVNFTEIGHTITYWITDCAGNESLPQRLGITIKPRPNILKKNE